MLSPKVISEGILSVSSMAAPAVSAASVMKKTPRELKSCVKPWPSMEDALSQKETGSRYGNL